MKNPIEEELAAWLSDPSNIEGIKEFGGLRLEDVPLKLRKRLVGILDPEGPHRKIFAMLGAHLPAIRTLKDGSQKISLRPFVEELSQASHLKGFAAEIVNYAPPGGHPVFDAVPSIFFGQGTLPYLVAKAWCEKGYDCTIHSTSMEIASLLYQRFPESMRRNRRLYVSGTEINWDLGTCRLPAPSDEPLDETSGQVTISLPRTETAVITAEKLNQDGSLTVKDADQRLRVTNAALAIAQKVIVLLDAKAFDGASPGGRILTEKIPQDAQVFLLVNGPLPEDVPPLKRCDGASVVTVASYVKGQWQHSLDKSADGSGSAAPASGAPDV